MTEERNARRMRGRLGSGSAGPRGRREPRTIVVFDLGNVFVRWNPRNYYRAVFNDDAKMERFLAEACNHDWILSLDAGVPHAEGIARQSAKFPQWAPYLAQYRTGWESMFAGVIQGTVDILGELKARGTPVYGLTNWSHETFPRGLELFPFLGALDGIVVSGVEGTVKPSPEIFRILLDRYGLRAERCVFTDDSAANVRGAEALGFAGHVFESPEKLRNFLRSQGLLA